MNALEKQRDKLITNIVILLEDIQNCRDMIDDDKKEMAKLEMRLLSIEAEIYWHNLIRFCNRPNLFAPTL